MDKGEKTAGASETQGWITRAKRELERMIDLNPHVLILIDGVGRVLRVNKALLELLGCRGFDEVLNKEIGALFKTDQPDFFDALLRDSSGLKTSETRIHLRAGDVRRMRFTRVGPSGRDGLRVIVVNDLSKEAGDAQRTEKIKRRATVKALAADLMHRLNQPLTVITVQAKLLQMAVERKQVVAREFNEGLESIMRLAMEIAGTLKGLEASGDAPDDILGGETEEL